MPSSSDSNQVVVEQWETESDSSSHSLSLKMEENIAERFSLLFLFSFCFSQCGTLLETQEKRHFCTPCKLFSSLLMNEIHSWISFWKTGECEGLSETQRRSRPPVVSWTESNRAGREREIIQAAFWHALHCGAVIIIPEWSPVGSMRISNVIQIDADTLYIMIHFLFVFFCPALPLSLNKTLSFFLLPFLPLCFLSFHVIRSTHS